MVMSGGRSHSELTEAARGGELTEGPAADGYVAVVVGGKLLFRFDPSRDLIEVVRRRVRTVVDLRQYRGQRMGNG